MTVFITAVRLLGAADLFADLLLGETLKLAELLHVPERTVSLLTGLLCLGFLRIGFHAIIVIPKRRRSNGQYGNNGVYNLPIW